MGEAVATRLIAPRTCRASADGFVWYRLEPGAFAPLALAYLDCPQGGTLGAGAEIVVPRWARAPKRTLTRFVAGTLQDVYSRAGTQAMEELARANGVPMTWMVGNLQSWRANRDIYLRGQRAGDDIEIEPYDDLLALVRKALPGFQPDVSIEGAGHERYIAAARARGSRAIWGIAWNSSGVDGTSDAGAPWGAYCADPAAYKRPARDGRCDLLSIEWTARDLTRAFWTGREDAYSTDPDDLLDRAALGPDEAAAYLERLADAYAAAGEFRPLLMMAQQESGQMQDAPRSRRILAALYARAEHDGMRLATMRELIGEAELTRLPRAVALPYLPIDAPFRRQIEPVAPATIDYVDERVALTFAAGRTTPLRVFDYDAEVRSRFDRPVPLLDPFDAPAIVAVASGDGELVLRVVSPRARRFGFAFWCDVDAAGVDRRSVVRAGRAGFVVPVDLAEGVTDVRVRGSRLAPDLPLSS